MDQHTMDVKYTNITKEAMTIMITMMVTFGLWTLKNAFKTSTILFTKMFNKVLIPNIMIMTTMMDIIMIMEIITDMTNTIMIMKVMSMKIIQKMNMIMEITIVMSMKTMITTMSMMIMKQIQNQKIMKALTSPWHLRATNASSPNPYQENFKIKL